MTMALIDSAHDKDEDTKEVIGTALFDLGKKKPMLVLSTCHSYLKKHSKVVFVFCLRKKGCYSVRNSVHYIHVCVVSQVFHELFFPASFPCIIFFLCCLISTCKFPLELVCSTMSSLAKKKEKRTKETSTPSSLLLLRFLLIFYFFHTININWECCVFKWFSPPPPPPPLPHPSPTVSPTSCSRPAQLPSCFLFPFFMTVTGNKSVQFSTYSAISISNCFSWVIVFCNETSEYLKFREHFDEKKTDKKAIPGTSNKGSVVLKCVSVMREQNLKKHRNE